MTENTNEKAQEEKPEKPEITPEQKALMEKIRASISKFQQVVSFYLFNQAQMMEDGEIHIHLTVKDREIGNIELTSRLVRSLVDGKKD